jgi:hypothetical protein
MPIAPINIRKLSQDKTKNIKPKVTSPIDSKNMHSKSLT